jgi:hypothetical protein
VRRALLLKPFILAIAEETNERTSRDIRIGTNDWKALRMSDDHENAREHRSEQRQEVGTHPPFLEVNSDRDILNCSHSRTL